MPVRLGVVADTHCPEFIERLPERLFEVLASVDLIVHAGDVNAQETLDELGRIAPVHAARGDHDGRLGLPRLVRLEVGGRRLAVIHGNRNRLIEEPLTFVGTVSLGQLWASPGLTAWLRRQAPDADVIVYGHTHAAKVVEEDGALIFNPGAVYQVDRAAVEARLRRRPNWFEWTWLQFMRFRRRTPRPSVGIITFHEDGRIEPEVIPL